MIPNGSIVTYKGTWYASLFSSSNGVVSSVGADLATAGLLVKSSKINVSTTAVVTGVIGLGGNTFDVVLTLQVENGLGYDSPESIINQVRDAVNSVTGRFPNADSIPSFSDTSGNVQSTGEPDVSTPDVTGCIAGSGNDTDGNFSISCWFKNLTTQGLSTVGLLALVAIAGIGLAVWASGRVEH